MDDITALVKGRNKDVAEMTKKGEEVERRRRAKRPQVVSHGKWEGRKEQHGCVVWFPGGRAASMQHGRKSDDGRRCRNAWSVLENESQEVGRKRKSEQKEMQGEIDSRASRKTSLPQELHESWVQKIVENGYGASKSVESACSGDGHHRNIQIW